MNQEQKEELGRRLEATRDRLPDHVVMAFRHLLMLTPGGHSGLQLDHIDLGPSTVNGRIDQRVIDHLVEADKLVVDQLAPAALLTERFGVFPAEAESLSLEDLRGYFGRHPHLPKLASTDVLRDCVVRGVREGVFGLALGAEWNGPDSVLRIDAPLPPDEVQFQPGVYLVKAGPIRDELSRRGAEVPQPETSPRATPAPTTPVPTLSGKPQVKGSIETVTIRLDGVPSDKVREVLKTAILPLAASGAVVDSVIEIRAVGGGAGIPRETLKLTVLEGLRQLGLDASISINGEPQPS